MVDAQAVRMKTGNSNCSPFIGNSTVFRYFVRQVEATSGYDPHSQVVGVGRSQHTDGRVVTRENGNQCTDAQFTTAGVIRALQSKPSHSSCFMRRIKRGMELGAAFLC